MRTLVRKGDQQHAEENAQQIITKKSSFKPCRKQVKGKLKNIDNQIELQKMHL